MNTNTNRKYINTLTVGDTFRLTGDTRMVNQWMTVEGVTSGSGRTVIRYVYPGGARGSFHRPGLTMVEIAS